MEFKTVSNVLGWAFQVSVATPVEVRNYRERTGRSVSELTYVEEKAIAMEVLAKVARLPEAQYSALAARFTRDIRAINTAAKCLPAGWPTPLRRELTRGWAHDGSLARDQKSMAETYLLSTPTLTRRKQQAFLLLDAQLATALEALTPQLSELLASAPDHSGLPGACIAA